jgi:hypothetical protein
MGRLRLRQGALQLRLTGRGSWRSAVIASVVGLGMLFAPPGALGATPVGLGVAADGTLTYVAQAGEQNQVLISLFGDSYIVNDGGVDSFADADGPGGCVVDPPSPQNASATCPAAGVARIRVLVSDGDDAVLVASNITVPASLFGQAGDDSLSGGSGDDTLNGGTGNIECPTKVRCDTLVGNAGSDTADYSSSSGPVTVSLATTQPQNTGAAGIDVLSDTIENLSGTAFGDTLSGGPTSNVIRGSGGNDVIDVRDDPAQGDFVVCGAGADLARTDVLDQPSAANDDCERVDNGVPPETAIASGPPRFSSLEVVTFEFSSTEPQGGSFECLFGGAPVSGCTAPEELSDLSEGDYSFSVAAIDEFGNKDATPAAYEFTIDRTPPTTKIESGPGGTTGDSTPTFAFSANEPQSTFECQLDEGDYLACESRYTTPVLTNGSHTLTVRARDRAGNVDQIGASSTFNVDTSLAPPPPSPGSTAPPEPVVTESKTIIFGSLVLISGRSVKLVKGRLVPVALTCSGQRKCEGQLAITSDLPLKKKRKRKRAVRLGTTKFSIEGNKRARVMVPLSPAKVRLVKRLRRLKVRATIREIDVQGHPRISTRTFFLRAR